MSELNVSEKNQHFNNVFCLEEPESCSSVFSACCGTVVDGITIRGITLARVVTLVNTKLRLLFMSS